MKFPGSPGKWTKRCVEDVTARGMQRALAQ